LQACWGWVRANQPDHKFRVASGQPLAPANHIDRVKFEHDRGGIGKGANAVSLLDEKQPGQVRIPQPLQIRFSLDETFDVGQDAGTPVVEDSAEDAVHR
jgi:hypothetical protein